MCIITTGLDDIKEGQLKEDQQHCMMSESPSPTNSLDQEILSNRSLDEAISNSARHRRVQTTTYLLGARQELPELCAEDVTDAHANSQGLTYNFRIPQHTTNADVATAYVDVGFADNTPFYDVFYRIHAYMDISPQASELGWRLSTDRRSDLPACLKTSFDLKNVFKSVRAKRYLGRKKKVVNIKILNFKSISKKVRAETDGRSSLSNVSTDPVTPPSPITHNHIHFTGRSEAAGQNYPVQSSVKRSHAMCLETDGESDDEPWLTIYNVIDVIDHCFPAMNFNQYSNTLCCQGIIYLTAAVNFDSNFYISDVGMSRGAASVFCRQVMKMKRKMKDD
ncbi:uncharacterized protein EDB91DRAFT_1244667 [Suillus paluster]|uniref:uncharacterized protein n=1 Tax=Suillus paluster TaxID=48578 RepID=UPI001B87DA64|nr:uncharacterized protein EDB91DRAFT_1244667 [Suillus paluster]KAG1748855.1 hypothetical protein EDB91DRAFT_1244667 [Suillus paluster]